MDTKRTANANIGATSPGGISAVDYRATTAVDTGMSAGTIEAMAASLLLGIRLRPWLTTGEQEFLDRLGFANHLTFLIRGGHYLHPEGLELFPLETIETSLRGGDAVFSHRCCVDDNVKRPTSRIHTARIHSDGAEPVVLGLMGPEDLPDRDSIRDHFCHLVDLFRRADASVREAFPVVAARLANGAAVIVVNRASGRVLHITEAASQLLGLSPPTDVGKEHGEILSHLGEVLVNHKITMENMTFGELHLSVATLTLSPPGEAKSKPDLPEDAGLLSQVSACFTAASHIHTHAQALSPSQIKDMAAIIMGGSAAMDLWLTRRRLLATSSTQGFRRVNIRQALENAIDRGTSTSLLRCWFRIEFETEQAFINAPPNIIECLLMSVLVQHQQVASSRSRSAIDLSDDAASNTLTLTIQTADPKPADPAVLERMHDHDTSALAERMGIRVDRHFNPQANTALTRLTLPWKGDGTA